MDNVFVSDNVAVGLTLVIPAYERASLTADVLRCVDAQRVRPQYVVLVDNNSQDGTFDVMCEWAAHKPWVKVLRQLRPGACAARNMGLEAVTTPWVMFFDSDDLMLPDHVADFAVAISGASAHVDIFGRSVMDEVCGGGGLRKLYFRDRDIFFNSIFRGCMSTQRIVVRTSLMRRAGGWNESLSGWDDFELGVRMLLLARGVMDIGGTPTVRIRHIGHSISGSDFGSAPQKWEPSLHLVIDHINRAVDSGILPSKACMWVRACGMVLAAQYAREGYASLAADMRRRMLEKKGGRRRLMAVYHHNRVFGRLTWVLVRLLF